MTSSPVVRFLVPTSLLGPVSTFFVAILVAAYGTVAAFGQPLGGTVIERPSGRAITHASVVLNDRTGTHIVALATSDHEGRFLFEELPLGTYLISALKDGYVAAPGGAKRPTSGKGDVTLALTRSAVITGRVLDAAGRPVVSAKVYPVVRYGGSQRVWYRAGKPSATVNDQGEYRLHGLAPGRYVLAAAPPIASPLAGRAFSPSYFPGVRHADEAEPISLEAGQTRESIDFVLQSAPAAYAISGRIRGLPEGPVGAVLTLFTASAENTELLQTVSSDSDGRFRFGGVSGGSYEIMAAGPALGGGLAEWGPLFMGETRRYGRRQVVVQSQDVHDVDLTLDEGVALEGRLSADLAQQEPPCYSDASVSLVAIEPAPLNELLKVSASADGSFRFPALPPARYRVTVEGLRNRCFLSEIRIGDLTANDGLVHVTQDTTLTQITIRLTTQAGTIHGIVRKQGLPAPGSTVISIPVGPDGDRWPQECRVDRADAEGRYALEPLGPGKYYILAVNDEEVQDDYCANESFWTLRSAHITSVALALGKRVAQTLEVFDARAAR